MDLWHEAERVMSWDIAESGLEVVMDCYVSTVVREDAGEHREKTFRNRLNGVRDLDASVCRGRATFAGGSSKRLRIYAGVDPHADKLQPGNGPGDFDSPCLSRSYPFCRDQCSSLTSVSASSKVAACPTKSTCRLTA